MFLEGENTFDGSFKSSKWTFFDLMTLKDVQERTKIWRIKSITIRF